MGSVASRLTLVIADTYHAFAGLAVVIPALSTFEYHVPVFLVKADFVVVALGAAVQIAVWFGAVALLAFARDHPF